MYADLLLRSELYILRAEMLQFDFVAASKERPRIGKQAADPDQSGIGKSPIRGDRAWTPCKVLY